MERLPALEEQAEQEKQLHGLFSCWGRLRLGSLWRRLIRRSGTRGRRTRLHLGRGSFRYDPLSYAQNFDDGGGDEEQAIYHRVVSSRFAALHTPPPATSAG